ncbi:2-phospho-L-lactate guanylyltransferase [Sphingomonas bacterium]|uniref:2-phospho-L-lactate guanylyltransferase n=1 Tax=Sphingomonas bacterium TaxID=1895847 RepID=UPI0015758CDA|nr:2-phospho-L-lactate guanylyltransferase [Sphingomonas bacterium]
MGAGWTVLVPIKPVGERKSRLADVLEGAAREALAERMLRHVLATIIAAGARPRLVSAEKPAWWDGDWSDDRQAPLNIALGAARDVLGSAPVAVVHGDLPALCREDLELLFAAADRDGVALAPDRHRIGTNAIALADDRPFAFAFGPDSFARHHRQDYAIVTRPGLGLDIDLPEDLEYAHALDAPALRA